jgi:hypothetical protein
VWKNSEPVFCGDEEPQEDRLDRRLERHLDVRVAVAPFVLKLIKSIKF